MGSRCVGASRARTGGVARVHDPSPWAGSVTPGSGGSPVSVDPDTCRPWSRDAARDSHDLTRSRRLRRRWRPERGTGKMKRTLHHVARAVVVFSSTSFRLARAMTGWPVDATVTVDLQTRPPDRASRRPRGGGPGTMRVEADAVAEHGAGDVEQTVGHWA